MRLIVGLLTCCCAFTVTQTFADEPPAQTSSADQTAQTSPAAAPSAAAPASTASSAQTASASKSVVSAEAIDDATDKRLRSQGYKPEVRNGTKIYCRKETEMGSRFPTKVCGTPEQLSAANKDSQDALNKAQLGTTPVKAN